MDLANNGMSIGGYALVEVVFVARAECNRTLGSWLRAEPRLGPPINDWVLLEAALSVAVEEWRQKMRSSGLKVHIPNSPEDYY